MTLELYAYPHLMGEAVDYEIDDSDHDGDDGDAAATKDEEMADDDEGEAERMLPRRMEELTIKDADGDVEMEM
jgi:hypothetical protein